MLSGVSHFSFEHAVAIARFLGLTETESDYFILLVHVAKAGSTELKQHYLNQLRKIQEARENGSERFGGFRVGNPH